MKNSIRLTAMFLLLGTGAFANVPGRKIIPATFSTEVAIKGLGSGIGVNISVAENLTTRPFVTIVDDRNNIIYNGLLSSEEGTNKSFNLSDLESGYYAVSVVWNNHEVKKVVHIYQDETQKKYVIN